MSSHKAAVALIEVKSKRELTHMRKACEIASSVLRELATQVAPGVLSSALDTQAKELIERHSGARPAFFGYRGFPANVCVSINAEVVHGIPTQDKVIKEGDVVSLDLGVYYEGYYGDCALTVTAGPVSDAARRLIEATKDALNKSLSVVRAGATVGDIGYAVQQSVESLGMNVIRDFVGHGIGRQLHEDPAIPNWGTPGRGVGLVESMTLAIEPMVTLGSGQVTIASDGWTATTKDKALAAHFEHTVLVLADGCEVLTPWDR